jgi:hypothetical protein
LIKVAFLVFLLSGIIKFPFLGRWRVQFLLGFTFFLGFVTLFQVLPSWHFRFDDWYRSLTNLGVFTDSFYLIISYSLSFWSFISQMEFDVAWDYDVLIRQTVEEHWDPVNLSSNFKLIPCSGYLMRFPFIVRGEDPAFVRTELEGKGYCLWGIAPIGI